MEVERGLNSIQWKILRSFLVATLGSAILFIILILLYWSFQVSQSSNLENAFPPIWIIMLLSGIAAIVVGVVIGFYMGRKMKKSLQSLSWAAESLTRGKLDHRIEVDGSDEISELSSQFNQMADRIENQVATLQKLVQKNAELHQEAKKVASHEERQRLARELHDSISQQLFAISMTTSAVGRLLDKDIEKAKKQFQYIENMAASTQAEMRALLLHLRPIQLSGKKLTEALEELLIELRQKHPITYEWDIDFASNLPLGVEEHLFRIVQEGISNALRHSKAKKIGLSLTSREQRLILKIRDDGIGMKKENESISSSMGLGNIRERVNEIGGILEILTAEGKGTTLEIRVPIVRKGGGDIA